MEFDLFDKSQGKKPKIKEILWEIQTRRNIRII